MNDDTDDLDGIEVPDTPAELLAEAARVDMSVQLPGGRRLVWLIPQGPTDPVARAQFTADLACTLAIFSVSIALYLYLARHFNI
jgi:hypothetical protein